MAEDFHDKTEEPTPKRLDEARRKGYVAKSQDLTISVHLILCLIVFFFFGRYMFTKLAALNFEIFNHLNLQFDQIEILQYLLIQGLKEIFSILMPLIFCVICISIIMNLLQNGVIFSLYPLMPKWGKLNIFNPKNYEQTLGTPAIVKLIFGIIRLQIVLLFAWIVNEPAAYQIFSLGKGSAKDILKFIYRESLLVSTATAFGYLVVGIMDLFYQKWSFLRKMRMSKREVKDEYKQLEGDVNVKNKIKTTMRSISQANLITQIPFADFLIADRSKYVIVLSYRPHRMSAPFCLCKGARSKALMMREMANRHQIPIIENPKLARDLFREVDPGSFIPSEFYPEVASLVAQNIRIESYQV